MNDRTSMHAAHRHSQGYRTGVMRGSSAGPRRSLDSSWSVMAALWTSDGRRSVVHRCAAAWIESDES
jgi:hypothetical protein